MKCQILPVKFSILPELALVCLCMEVSEVDCMEIVIAGAEDNRNGNFVAADGNWCLSRNRKNSCLSILHMIQGRNTWMVLVHHPRRSQHQSQDHPRSHQAPFFCWILLTDKLELDEETVLVVSGLVSLLAAFVDCWQSGKDTPELLSSFLSSEGPNQLQTPRYQGSWLHWRSPGSPPEHHWTLSAEEWCHLALLELVFDAWVFHQLDSVAKEGGRRQLLL